MPRQNPFLTGATSAGGRSNPFLGGATGPSSAPAKKSGGGFLHTLGQGLSDLESAAVNSPAGIYQLGKATAHDTQAAVGRLPGASYRDKQAAREKSQLLPIARATVQGFKQDVQHPLRHPGYTALDLLGAASLGAGTAARGAAVLGKIEEGARASEIAAAALRRPPLEPRILTHEGQPVEAGTYSRSALARGAQKARDVIQQNHPEPRYGPKLVNRVGKELHLNQRVTEMLNRAPAEHLVHAARGLNRGQRLAIRVVAEGVPLNTRIVHATQALAGASRRTAKMLTRHIQDLKAAKPYLASASETPRLAEEQTKLASVYSLAKDVSDKRTGDLIGAGVLDPETASEAVSRAGRAIHGQLGENANQLSLLNPNVLPEVFHNKEGFYVTYAQTPRSVFRPARIGNTETVGIPRQPGSLKTFTGRALETGQVEANTPRVVAKSLLESNRLLNVVNRRRMLARFARDEKPAGKAGENFIPIRPIWLKNKPFPPEVKDAIAKLEDDSRDQTVRQRAAQRIEQWLHPEESTLTPEAVKAEGIKWVNKRLLYKENLPRALVGVGQNPGARRVLAVNDGINNAERIALLYAKPSYAIPNLAGNVALNVIQQGPWAVKNITRAARLNAQLGTRDALLIDAGLGEGISTSLVGGENLAPGARATQALGGAWGFVVDRAFRRSSFLHEAAKEGFKTKTQIHALLNDKTNAAAKIRVFRRANEAIIDYGRLGPFEQDVLRRVLFLYPWVKGSTRFAGQFAREHPYQADAAAHLAAQAQAKASADFGLPTPSWFDGYFKTGSILGQKSRGPGIPYASNPAAAAIFQTPAQLLEAAQEVVGLQPQKAAYQVPGLLTPTLAALSAAETRKDSFTGYNYPPNVAPARIFADQLYGGIPLMTLRKRIGNPNPAATSPMTTRDALLQILLGSLAPRPIDVAKLHTAGAKEQSGR